MRKFFLRNEGGTVTREYQLQYSDAFLWQPGGLGFSYNNAYRAVDGFHLITNSELNQTAKTGIIVFHGSSPYADYKEFVDWVIASEKLKLAYSTDDIAWYYMDIDIESVDKTEIELDGTLQCSISMLPTSPVYMKSSNKFKIDGDLPSGMKQYSYDSIADEYYYTYKLDPDAVSPYTEADYWYTYSDTAVAGELVINVEAQLPCGIEIYTETPVSAPVITFYDGSDAIGQVDLSAVSVSSGEKLLYSGLPTSAGVTFTDSGGTKTDITNLLGMSASVPSFFTLPPNRNIRAVLSATSLLGVEIEVRIYKYFASV